MLFGGYVLTLTCDVRELHPYAYGTATYMKTDRNECIETAKREGWTVEPKTGRCACPIHTLVTIEDGRKEKDADLERYQD